MALIILSVPSIIASSLLVVIVCVIRGRTTELDVIFLHSCCEYKDALFSYTLRSFSESLNRKSCIDPLLSANTQSS